MAQVPSMSTGTEDSDVKPNLKPQPLTNFRRFLRSHPNASDPSKEDPVIRRFYVLLERDFAKEVKLPVQVCRDLARKNVPGDAVLISYKGMWKVDISRCICHKDLVLSGNGWLSFIRHHDLKQHDLVWFEQTDSMVFRIHAFDLLANGEKLCPGYEQEERSRNDALDHVFTSLNFGSFRRHGFTVSIGDFHLKMSYLTIPADFVRSNGDLKQKKRVILVTTRGDAWEVELRTAYDRRVADYLQRNFKMRRGWPAFMKANKLQISDFVVFVVDNYSRLSSPENIVMNVRIRRTI